MQLLFLLTSWSPEVKSIRRWWRRFLKCLLAKFDELKKICPFKASCVSSRCGRIRIEQIWFSISPKVSLVYLCSHDLAKGTWGSKKLKKYIKSWHSTSFPGHFPLVFLNDQPFPGIPLGCLAVLGQGHGMGQRVQQIHGCAPLWFTTWRLQRCFRCLQTKRLGGLVTDATELPVAD